MLRDDRGLHITSQMLREGQDPAGTARKLLREKTAGSDFNRPRYPLRSVA
jgi:hypothetical protein